ncbi:hypothetical protein ACJX0J_030932, partial [Zea mays]
MNRILPLGWELLRRAISRMASTSHVQDDHESCLHMGCMKDEFKGIVLSPLKFAMKSSITILKMTAARMKPNVARDEDEGQTLLSVNASTSSLGATKILEVMTKPLPFTTLCLQG